MSKVLVDRELLERLMRADADMGRMLANQEAADKLRLLKSHG